METKVYCESKTYGTHSFYLISNEVKYFLFDQDFKASVNNFFRKGVSLKKALDFSNTHRNHVIVRTINKLPLYIKYIEKVNGIEVLKQTKKKNTPWYKKKTDRVSIEEMLNECFE